MRKSIKTLLITTFALLSLTACGVVGPSDPSPETIKADLLGHTIGNTFIGPFWTFESLSEFEQFYVTKTLDSGEVIEFKADTILKRPSYRYSAKLNIVYRLQDGKWMLIQVGDNQTLSRLE